MVCQHEYCYQRGSAEVLKTFQAADLPEDVEAIATGCQGQCSSGPTRASGSGRNLVLSSKTS